MGVYLLSQDEAKSKELRALWYKLSIEGVLLLLKEILKLKVLYESTSTYPDW